METKIAGNIITLLFYIPAALISGIFLGLQVGERTPDPVPIQQNGAGEVDIAKAIEQAVERALAKKMIVETTFIPAKRTSPDLTIPTMTSEESAECQ